MGDTPDYENGQPKPVSNNFPSMHDLVSNDMQERKKYGLKKYDSLLQPFNGRNFLQDSYEEVQDLIVYLKGSLEEQKVVEFFFRSTLQGYLALFDIAFPDKKNEVVVRAGVMPGWLLKIYQEELGDRFEYSDREDDRSADVGVPD